MQWKLAVSLQRKPPTNKYQQRLSSFDMGNLMYLTQYYVAGLSSGRADGALPRIGCYRHGDIPSASGGLVRTLGPTALRSDRAMNTRHVWMISFMYYMITA